MLFSELTISFALRDSVAIPVHGSRASPRTELQVVNSINYPLALSLSKGSEHIATRSVTGKD
jgi:hypothetical protein